MNTAIHQDTRELEFAGWRFRVGGKGTDLPTIAQGQTLAGLAAGMTQKEIARARNCSPSTVKHAVSSLLYHLDASRAAAAVATAISRGWIAPLMLVLMFTDLHHQAMRVRQPSRNRIFDSAMVTPFGKTSSSAGDDGPEPTTDIWMEMAA